LLLFKNEQFETIFRSKKYILTLVPIFVVCPTLGVAGFLLRHRLRSLAKRCCRKKGEQVEILLNFSFLSLIREY
jgi:hypothetical protein